MSKYTTEVRFICEKASGFDESVGFDSVNDVINNSWDKVFNFDFPIFDEEYRPVLCKKILMYYYTREISEETVGLWKVRLWSKLNLIMPYYNKLYQSALLEFNPLYDVDYYRKTDRTTDGTGTTDTTNSGVSRNLYSDTPQGGLEGVDSETYLTSATKDITNATGNTSTGFNNTDDFLEHVWGKHPGVSYSKLLQEYRKTFINIDEQIIEELRPLFFNLW